MSKSERDGTKRKSGKVQGEERKTGKDVVDVVTPDLSRDIGTESKKEKKSNKRKRNDTLEATSNTPNGIIPTTDLDPKRKRSKSKKSHEADNDVAHVTTENTTLLQDEPKKSKKKKSRKENKPEDLDAIENSTSMEAEETVVDLITQEDKKEKRKGKKQKKQNEDTLVDGNTESLETMKTAQTQTNAGVDVISNEASIEESDHKARFIVFIGQLPFTATVDHVTKHFEKLSPTSIRLPTRREDETRNKGFAFLEFEAYDRMKTCLKLYHRSTFDDGISPPRKIKVELTAGGGGSTEQRKEKIRHKNERLSEQRHRRAQEEASQRFKQETKKKFAEAKGQRTKSSGPRGGPRVDQQLQESSVAEAGETNVGHSGMHPDRLARLV